MVDSNNNFPFALTWVYMLAGIYVSLMSARSHYWLHWTRPREQTRILVMLAMPSIVMVASFVAFHTQYDSKTLFLVLDSIKECSVGLGIVMFSSLLLAYLNIDSNTISTPDILPLTKKVICNVFPVTLFQPKHVVLSLNYLKCHQYWTRQFLVILLVCSIFIIFLHLFDMYPLWLSWVFFGIFYVSIYLALYTVIAFNKAFFEESAPPKHNLKVLCLAGVVFVCFFQGGVLKALVAMGIIKSNSFWRQEQQNFLLIIEMSFFIMFQRFAYDAKSCYGDCAPVLPVSLRSPNFVGLNLPFL